MDHETPESPPTRRIRLRHRWAFERLERRVLLATTPVVATRAQLDGATPILDAASGLIAPGVSELFRFKAASDELLIAKANAGGARTRLSILDDQGHLLAQGDGLSVANPTDLVALHVGAGTYDLELTGLAGVARFTVTIGDQPSIGPAVSQMLDNDQSVVTGDFNGDGRVDIAAANAEGISVLLGNGDGTFRAPVLYATPGNGSTLAVGDFNGDGRLDLAAGYQVSETALGQPVSGVSVLLGDGDGTFRSSFREDFEGASDLGQPTVVVAGDFNGDGRQDVAVGYDVANPVTDTFDGFVAVLLGHGDGTFRDPEISPIAGQLTALAVGDFNGDGHADLVVGDAIDNSETGALFVGVSVLLGLGDGTFRDPIDDEFDPATADFITSLAVGDFNGDGSLDLAVGSENDDPTTNEITGGVIVLLGNHDGRFRGPLAYATPGVVDSVAVGDFNGDGRLDIAAAFANGPDPVEAGVALLLGQGGGSFRGPVVIGTSYGVYSLAVGNFDRGGTLDLAIGDFDGASVLLGRGDGTFRSPADYPSSGINTPLAVGDFNGDGQLDVVVDENGESENAGISVLLGKGEGTFQPPANYLRGFQVSSAVVGDFNGDGRLDLAAGYDETGISSTVGPIGGVVILLGNGDGTFHSPVNDPLPDAVFALAFGKVGGKVNLYAGTSAGVSVLVGDGGTFHALANIATPGDVFSLATGDFNRDGRIDLAASYQGEDPNLTTPVNGVAVLLGNADGTQQGPIVDAFNSVATDNVNSLAVGDFNGDGRLDLALASDSYGILVLPGRGDGTFADPINSPTNLPLTGLVPGDFDGDGRVDLAGVDGSVLLLRGDGDGTFRAPVAEPTSGAADSFAAGDFNGDGRVDLFYIDASTGRPAVLFNTGGGVFSNSAVVSTPGRENPILADIDGDGTPDLTVVDQAGDILWRKGIPGRPGSYEPPIVVNPGDPARDIAVVPNAGRELIAGVDENDNSLTLYADFPADPLTLYTFGGERFAPVGTLATGSLPAEVVTADLDGLGPVDLVVRSAGDGTLSIFRPGPFGGFSRAADLAVGLGDSDVVAADLSGSGRDDLIVTNQAEGVVRVLANLGGGAFGLPSIYQAGAGPYGLDVGPDGTVALDSQEASAGVAVGAFGPGARPGLAVIDPGSNTLAILDGLGGGALANARTLPTTEPGDLIRAADLRGDGVTDLVVLGPSGLDVYLGEGRGGFAAEPSHYDVSPGSDGLTVADVDGDGKLDLLIGDSFGDVLVLLGDGDGTFRPFGGADRGIALAVADLTGDGQTDIIYADQGADRVAIQYGNASPTAPPDQQPGLLAPDAVMVADFTIGGTTTPYLIVANGGSNDVLVYPGIGDGQFGPALNGGRGFFTGDNPVGVTVAYLTDDGLPDLVVADKGSNDVAILLGRVVDGSLTFTPGPRLKAGAGPVATAVVAVPGSAQPDILVSDSRADQVLMLPGLGQGFFDDQSPTVIPVGDDPGPLFVGTFLGRPGELDLITVNSGSNSLSLVPDFSHGGVAEAISTRGTDPTSAVAFTYEGEEGLIVANEGDGEIAAFLGGVGEFAYLGEMSDAGAPSPTALAVDALSGNVLEFYAGTEGRESATFLTFNLAGTPSGSGGVPPILEPPGDSGSIQVAVLQPLGGESTLALVASLTTVSLNFDEPEATAVEVSEAPAGASGGLPNQPISRDEASARVVDEEADPEADRPEAPPSATPSALSPLMRFLYGLDEALERTRLERHEVPPTPRADAGGAGRAIDAFDAVLGRWPAGPIGRGVATPAPAARPTSPVGLAMIAAVASLTLQPISRAIGDGVPARGPGNPALRRRGRDRPGSAGPRPGWTPDA